MARCVSSGMTYLSDMGFIHRVSDCILEFTYPIILTRNGLILLKSFVFILI